MRIKVAEYIADFLSKHGIERIFTVTGEASIFLNDAFSDNEDLKCLYNHHEAASAVAAASYAKLTNKMAVVCVSAGPGVTNALTGVFEAWADSLPLMVISGQVRRDQLVSSAEPGVKLRQLGIQECRTAELVKSITKYSVTIMNPNEIRFQLERAFFSATNGRKGPVWIDVPIDVQSTVIETMDLTGCNTTFLQKNECPRYDSSNTDRILEHIRNSKRPVIIAGEGLRHSDAMKGFLEMTNSLKVPVVAEWSAQDVLWDDNPYYCGIPGTIGGRGPNFIVQSADLLLIIGCRMNSRLVGPEPKNFASKAYKIEVNIDKNELKRPDVDIDYALYADCKDVCRDLANCVKEEVGDHSKWLKWCKNIYRRFQPFPDSFYENTQMNPYVFLRELSWSFIDTDVIVCGSASASIQSFQAFVMKKGQRIYSSSGGLSTGYGIPAAIGAAIGRLFHRRVICVEGDGGLMMNLQELQTIVSYHLPIKLFILQNNGYLSIRQAQNDYFPEKQNVGVSKDTGLGFPNIEIIAKSFGIPYLLIDSMDGLEDKLKLSLKGDGPMLIETRVDPMQGYEPRMAVKAGKGGKITYGNLDDMYPYLSNEEYASIKSEALSIEKD